MGSANMNNENFQELMLEHFGKVLNRLDTMDSRLKGVETEISEVKTELSQVKTGLSQVKTELSEVKGSQIRMETEFGKKLDVLYFDWRKTQKQFNEEVKSELQILDTKVEALQMESTKHDQEIKELYLVKPSND